MKSNIIKGRNCLVTGSNRGIGKHIAYALANAGCNLLLSGREEAELIEVRNDLIGLYPDLIIYSCEADLTNHSELEKLILFSKKNIPIDILINNAGIFSKESVLDIDKDLLRLMLATNVEAPIILTQALLENMVNNKWGRVVNIGSSSGYSGFKNTSLYCSSKHALLGFSRSLNKEVLSQGVRSYYIAPGSVKTRMGRKILNQNYEEFLEPFEVAEQVIKIISDDSNFIQDETRLNRTSILIKS